MLFVLQWKRLAARLAVLAALAAVFGLPGAPLLAHSKGPKTTPPHGSELAAPPRALGFSFARPVRLTAVRLYNAEGGEVELPGKRSIKPAKTRSIELPPLEAGSYRVEWRALSADGHPVDGEFSFSITPAN